MSEQHKWRSSPAIICQHWGEGAVVFHKPSGQTHQLSSLGYMLLNQLRNMSQSQAQLAIDCAEVMGIPVDDITDIVESALQQMSELGLVEQDR